MLGHTNDVLVASYDIGVNGALSLRGTLADIPGKNYPGQGEVIFMPGDTDKYVFGQWSLPLLQRCQEGNPSHTSLGMLTDGYLSLEGFIGRTARRLNDRVVSIKNNSEVVAYEIASASPWFILRGSYTFADWYASALACDETNSHVFVARKDRVTAAKTLYAFSYSSPSLSLITSTALEPLFPDMSVYRCDALEFFRGTLFASVSQNLVSPLYDYNKNVIAAFAFDGSSFTLLHTLPHALTITWLKDDIYIAGLVQGTLFDSQYDLQLVSYTQAGGFVVLDTIQASPNNTYAGLVNGFAFNNDIIYYVQRRSSTYINHVYRLRLSESVPSSSVSPSTSSSCSPSRSASTSLSKSASTSPSVSASPSPSIGPWPSTEYPVISARIIRNPHVDSGFTLRLRSSIDPSESPTTTLFYMKPGSQTVHSLSTSIVSTWPFELEATIDDLVNNTPGKWIFRPFISVRGRQFNCDAFFLNVQPKLAYVTQAE